MSQTGEDDEVTLWGEQGMSIEITREDTHRLLAPLVYGPRRFRTDTRPLLDRYMACRRRLGALRAGPPPSARERRRLERNLINASQLLLACVAIEANSLVPL